MWASRALRLPRFEALAGNAATSKKVPLLSSVALIGKGGSGKSTMCISLAVIARMAGLRVAILDADPQQSSFVWKCVRGRGDIPVCRCSPEALNDAIEAARRAGIELLFIDMPPDLRHAPGVARHADLVLIPMRPTLFDLQVTRALVPLLTSVGVRYAVVLNAAPPVRDHAESPMVRQARSSRACASKVMSFTPSSRLMVRPGGIELYINSDQKLSGKDPKLPVAAGVRSIISRTRYGLVKIRRANPGGSALQRRGP